MRERATLPGTETLGFAALVLLGVVVSAGCKCGTSGAEETLHVYAASSLKEVFRALERRFEATHPGVDVGLNFAGSQVLRIQISQGAPADVFASADARHIQALVDEGRVVEAQIFAHNTLAVIVPPDNPAGIDTFADLPRAQRLVIGSESVPAGRYARELLHRTVRRLGASFEKKVLSRVVSQENNVRLVRAKVALGEADAAIVYQTDALASERVRLVSIPAEVNVRATYLIGVVDGTAHRALAERWVAFLRSAKGRAILSQHGFVVE